MENINDYYRYTQLMRNGFYDKLFFIDKLFYPWESLFDYGCADGFQTKMIAQIFPDKKICGYDSDPDMITRALWSGSMPANISFQSNDSVGLDYDVAFYSSVIHEVHSYKTIEEAGRFWLDVFNPERKYVVIRDMMMSNPQVGGYSQLLPIESRIKQYCKDKNIYGEFQRFVDIFAANAGLQEMKTTLTHFMLKMPYINSPNWNREIHENYLPITMEKIVSMPKLEGGDWELVYQEAYTLPYLKYWWKENAGIDMPFTTHGKLIFHNKNK